MITTITTTIHIIIIIIIIIIIHKDLPCVYPTFLVNKQWLGVLEYLAWASLWLQVQLQTHVTFKEKGCSSLGIQRFGQHKGRICHNTSVFFFGMWPLNAEVNNQEESMQLVKFVPDLKSGNRSEVSSQMEIDYKL